MIGKLIITAIILGGGAVLLLSDNFDEYISPYAERLKWISNFSGSAGKVIVLQNKAFIFVDGRYTFQTHQQVDSNNFSIIHVKDYWNWIENNIKDNFL